VSVTEQQTVKKFINSPDDVVPESLAGLAAAHPDLVRVDFESQQRTVKDSGRFYSEVVRANALPDL